MEAAIVLQQVWLTIVRKTIQQRNRDRIRTDSAGNEASMHFLLYQLFYYCINK